jgi:hypothetical protein
MTEAEWLACDDPGTMLDFLLGIPGVSDRKFRLFACACGRLSWQRLDQRRRLSIEIAEQHADGLTTDYERGRVFQLSEPELRRERLSHLVAAWMCLRPNARHAAFTATRNSGAACLPVLQDIFGRLAFRPLPRLNPAWLAWEGGTVAKLATAAYEERAFDRLPILADALEEAGCDAAELLTHLRGPGPHVRGCWAVDLLLGRE